MKYIYILIGVLFLTTSCDTDLEQFPPNFAQSNSLTNFEPVLFAAYGYHVAAIEAQAVMGEFRSDNALMFEEPYPEFDEFDNGLTVHSSEFFQPYYATLYQSILSANNVIENSENEIHVGEAKFLRALSYFKLVQTFGDVTVHLTAEPSVTDQSILERQSVDDVYDDVIIPDLEDAISVLSAEIENGRASKYAAQGLLGKVYVTRGDYPNAESHLATVVNGAEAAGIVLQENFEDVFATGNDLNSEIIFATQISSSVQTSNFSNWFTGGDTKAPDPVTQDLIDAFDASGGATVDLRKALTVDEASMTAVKYSGNPDDDWIELRLADVILLYAETLNENGSSAEEVLDLLDPLRTRAGLDVLDHTTINTQELVGEAIFNERRVELAFEGHRWNDLIRTGTAQEEVGVTFDDDYYLFPIPISEVLASFGVIDQNDGY